MPDGVYTPRRQNRPGLFLLTGAARVIAVPFVLVYRLLDKSLGLRERGARQNLINLEHEVRKDFAWLFQERGARILANQSHGEPMMDFATLVLETTDLKLRAVRDRGYTYYSLASAGGKNDDWTPLRDALSKCILAPGIFSDSAMLRERYEQIVSCITN